MDPGPSSSPALAVRDLRFRYRARENQALDGVSFEVEKGQMIVLLGPSGAGKSTLCLALNGLIPHFSRGTMEGEVTVFGTSTRHRSVAELANQVGLVFQDFEAQLFATNVALEVAFGLENFGVDRPTMEAWVAATLALVGLSGLEHREPASLSGGQKQRLAIAAVLALHPRILVMDEPTTDLDPAGSIDVLRVARQLRDEGRTLVVAEHEIEALTGVDRVLVLNRGRIEAVGSPDQILTRAGWLERRGIQPPGAAHLLELLGEPPVLDVERATTQLRSRGYHVPDDTWSALTTDPDPILRAGPPLLRLSGVGHRYPGGVEALAEVELELHAGEFVGIVGANGSGKTTLIKHLNGLLEPTSGQVYLEDRPTRGMGVRELGLTVGYVFQSPDHQLFAESVREEVAFALRNHGLDGIEDRVDEALKAVGLAERDDEDPFTMTKGERQRVAVASVLATRPRIIVLDEPTTGLDYGEQRRMMELVARLNREGRTILCVTHSMWVVAEYARRTVVLAEGRIVADGPTRQVFGDETLLERARLRAPQVVEMTRALGRPLLSVAEAARCLVREE